ncbi:integrase core domain-containing protein [Actinopolymorpha sp. B11F2]|uniref:integrase core domain-containing protein n=1 Tax=Actinopolymorpha sp. B11F2 TaxID=3160862 RepID=UPI0032E3C170
MLAVLTSERFCDKSVAQTWATLLDEGTYLCSMSTMHRLLRTMASPASAAGKRSTLRRRSPNCSPLAPGRSGAGTSPSSAAPDAAAGSSSTSCSTSSPATSLARTVQTTEDSEIAKTMLEEAMGVHGIPEAVHTDRGTSMTSKPVAQLLLDLGVDRSHSRPRVSNDNPFSEAAFKILKYAPIFPEAFGSIADARAFCEAFFGYYNHEHMHSGIGAAHARVGAHARRGPRPTAADPGRRPHRSPRTVRQLPTPGTETARRSLNQPTITGAPHTDSVTRLVSDRLTSSAMAWNAYSDELG